MPVNEDYIFRNIIISILMDTVGFHVDFNESILRDGKDNQLLEVCIFTITNDSGSHKFILEREVKGPFAYLYEYSKPGKLLKRGTYDNNPNGFIISWFNQIHEITMNQFRSTKIQSVEALNTIDRLLNILTKDPHL